MTVSHYPKKQGLLQSLLGGDADATAVARWVVYRFIREDVAQTWELLQSNPALVTEGITP